MFKSHSGLEATLKVRAWTSKLSILPQPKIGPQCPYPAVPPHIIGPQCPYVAVPPHIIGPHRILLDLKPGQYGMWDEKSYGK